MEIGGGKVMFPVQIVSELAMSASFALSQLDMFFDHTFEPG